LRLIVCFTDATTEAGGLRQDGSACEWNERQQGSEKSARGAGAQRAPIAE
jgi:hypothetical protein